MNGWFFESTAQATQAASQAGPAGRPDQQGLGPIIYMILPIVILGYFLLIRPQKAEQRKRENMLKSLAKGDSAITSGGIYGIVDGIDESKGLVTLNIAPKVNIKVLRSAITSVTKKSDRKETSEE